MTGYTVHTGSTVKFSGGWDRIFTGKSSRKLGKAAATKAVSKSARKKSAKKPVKQAKRSK